MRSTHAAISDELWDLLPGYLIFRSIMPNRPPTEHTVQALVDEVIIPSLTRTERPTGEGHFSYQPDQAAVDGAGRRRGGRAGRVRRRSTARRLRLSPELIVWQWSLERDRPLQPQNVVYEVFGAPGATATINYQDVHAAPQRVDNVPLPWSYTITTTDPAVIANLVAQGNGNTLGCRIIVNGVVKDERTVNELNAYTFCLDKSG